MHQRGKRLSLPTSKSPSSIRETLCRGYKSSTKVSLPAPLFSPKEDEEFSLVLSEGDSNGASNADSDGENISGSSKELQLPLQELHGDKAVTSSSPLVKAIRDGNLAEVITLSEGTKFDEVDANGNTLLHYACQTANCHIIKFFLDNGCNVEEHDTENQTPLHLVVNSGKEEAVSLLLEAGALLDVSEKKHGQTPIHYAALLSSPNCLKIIIQKLNGTPWEARRILSIPDKDGRSVLHMAAERGKPEIVEALLAGGADVGATDKDGFTPLHVALLSHIGKRRCGGILDLLLDAGGEVEIEGGEKNERISHFAARVGCSLCLKFLLKKGANFSARNRLGRTPLHIATYENKTDATKFLISEGVDLEAVDNAGFRPLHMAILGECPNIIGILIASGVDTCATDTNGSTYIQFAITRRRIQAFQALAKAKAVTLSEGSDEDVLHYCSALGSINAVTFLLDQGWEIDITDAKGRTALHRALNHGNEDLATMLINKGANLKILDHSEASPLHYAVRWGGSDAILRLLLKKNVNLRCRDRLGRTPLHYAASKFSIMSDLYILLGAGSVLDVQDNMGLTPLHLAARLGNESLVRILLENGAKHDIVDVDNFIPIDHAKEKDNKSIIKRLEDHANKISSGEVNPSVARQTKEDSLHYRSTHRKSVAW